MSRVRRTAVLVALAASVALLPAPPAAAGNFGSPPGRPEPQAGPVREQVTPVSAPARTCTIYGSSSSFGLLCSDAVAGVPLVVTLREAGIDLNRRGEFCWDDPDLPDGFRPREPTEGPGQWFVHTCLSFTDGVIVRRNAQITYEFRFHGQGRETRLTREQEVVIDRITDRGQIPFLALQTSPVASPRVGQDVAFTMLCSPKLICTDTPSGRRIETPRLDVGGVVMHAELVHTTVRPLGDARPGETVDCTGGGLPRTAEQLDAGPADQPGVCRYAYERSSDGAGGGQDGDRVPVRVSAYWQVFYDRGAGPQPLARPYEKRTTQQVRVTEVQTLVVS